MSVYGRYADCERLKTENPMAVTEIALQRDLQLIKSYDLVMRLVKTCFIQPDG